VGSERPDDLIVAPWPTGDSGLEDASAEARMALLQGLIVEVRRLRKEYGVPEGERIAIHVSGGGVDLTETVQTQASALERLARVNQVHVEAGSGVGAHAVLADGGELFVPLEGVIDLDRERERLRTEIERLTGQAAATGKKLENENFVSRAPAEVVGKEREKLAQFQEQSTKLQEKLDALEGGAS
jgi:valyl-tRNA synthetase